MCTNNDNYRIIRIVMNKKNMIFALLMGIFASSALLPMQQLTSQQEKQRIEHIVCFSKGGALSVAQYAVNGSFSNDLIDRDITLFEKNSVEILNKKSWAEGYVYSWMIPGMLKTVAVPAALGSCAAGIATGVGSVFVYRVWNSSTGINFLGKAGLKVADFIEIDIMEYCENYKNYLRFKTEYLMGKSDYNKQVLSAAPCLLGTFAATFVLAGISKYSFNKASNYNQRNSAFIQEMQQQYDRNQVVIAQLQHIKYENHS